MARKSKKSPPKAIEANSTTTTLTTTLTKRTNTKATSSKANTKTTTPKSATKTRQTKKSTKNKTEFATRSGKVRKYAATSAVSEEVEIDLTHLSPNHNDNDDDDGSALPPLALLTSSSRISQLPKNQSPVIVIESENNVEVEVNVDIIKLNKPSTSSSSSLAVNSQLSQKKQPSQNAAVVDQSTPKSTKVPKPQPSAGIIIPAHSSKSLFNNFVMEENFSPIRQLRSNYLVDKKNLEVYYGEVDDDDDEDEYNNEDNNVVPKLNRLLFSKNNQHQPNNNGDNNITTTKTSSKDDKLSLLPKKRKRRKKRRPLKQIDLKQVLDKFDMEIQKCSQEQQAEEESSFVSAPPNKSPELMLDDDDDFDEIIIDPNVPVAQTQEIELNEEDFFGDDDDVFGSFIDQLPDRKQMMLIPNDEKDQRNAKIHPALLPPPNQSTPLPLERIRKFTDSSSKVAFNNNVKCSTPNIVANSTGSRNTMTKSLAKLDGISMIKQKFGKQLDFSMIDDDIDDVDIDVDELIVSKVNNGVKKNPDNDNGNLVTIQLKKRHCQRNAELSSENQNNNVEDKLLTMDEIMELIDLNTNRID